MPDQPSYSVPLEQGTFFILNPTSPAAGSDFILPPADYANRRLLIEAIRFTFTTDANVADRRFNIQWTDLGGFGSILQWNTVQAASLARVYFLRPGPGTTATLFAGNLHGPMYENMLIIHNRCRLELCFSNIQAGDAITGIYIQGRQWAERSA